MKHTGLIILVCLLLAACDSGEIPGVSYDAENARATLAIVAADARATDKEAKRVSAEETRAAYTTQQASNALVTAVEEQIKGTATAFDLETTRTAIAFGMESTRVAGTEQAAGTAAAFVKTATPAAATQVAIANAIITENTTQQIRMAQKWIWTFLAPSLVAFVLVIAVILAFRYFDKRIRWMDGDARLLDRRNGTIFLKTRANDFTPQLVQPTYRRPGPGSYVREEVVDAVFSLDASGAVLGAPVKTHTVSPRKGVELLYASADKVGDDATAFPGCLELGWSSSTWQKGIEYWEVMGIVDPTRGAKKRLINEEYPALGHLIDAIELGTFKPWMARTARHARHARTAQADGTAD